ncbi:hypothetical protein A5482_007860 [Cyanobacterium sp. IPPAS B-1200]|uniref:hypothetical protein n=1 Tax=Cyanobacterium sp. IPPAS B-1200 TaxID=1562720 RepID=UPI000852663D|nr:hypothetical protein [Cyanobacterium sp. IPPAS B-1200]OEJ77521.1 hypothetical protein A5482_05445 [Cyanobacterium sp. IPPAS B-1200]
MPHLNISTLKGALWGALAGDFFARYPHQDLYLNYDLESFSPYLEVIFIGFERIIKDNSFNVETWVKEMKNNNCYIQGLIIADNEQNIVIPLEIALLPLILSCYESKNKLEHNLDQLDLSLNINNDNRENIFNLHLIINCILTHNNNNITQVFDLNSSEKIEKIKQFINHKKNINELEKEFKQHYHQQEIGLYQGIYSFLSLSNYVELSLLRSTNFKNQKSSTSILTGFLLGLHNGYHALPFSLKKYFQLIPIVKEKNIDLLSQQFIDNWQGKYTKNPLSKF